MKYIKSLNYVSPLLMLLKDIEPLNVMDGFSLLEKHVESLISLDYEKFVHPIVLKSLENELKELKRDYSYYSSEQYYLTEDTRYEEIAEIRSRKETQKDKLKSLITRTNSTKRELKKSFPNLWGIYLEIKAEYGEKRHLQHDNLTGTLKGLTKPLLDFVSLFTNKNSFAVNNFIDIQNNRYKNSEAFKLFPNYKKDKLGYEFSLNREELKLIPVHILVQFVELMTLEIEHITDNDIYESINHNNMMSDKKSLEKLIKNRKNTEFIKEWWNQIQEIDKNNKLITIV